MKPRDEDEPENFGAASNPESPPRSRAVTAMELFDTGVIQSHLPSLSETEEQVTESVLGEVGHPSIMEAKPKTKVARTNIVVRDEGDTGAASSSDTAAEAAFNCTTLEEDRMRVTDKRQFVYPWERGPMKQIFGDSSLIKKPKLSVQPSPLNSLKVAVGFDSLTKATAYIEKEAAQFTSGIFISVVHSSVDIDHKAEKVKKRVEAVENWWGLVSKDLSASLIGRKVIDETIHELYDDYGRELLDACFGLKSPDTLRKRFLSMKAFFDWCSLECDQPALPLRESHAWKYIRHLKATGAPATKATTFMEALRFCWYIIGMDGGDEIQASLRARGLSSQLFVTKRPWRPADLLTIQEVLRLHSFLESSEHHLVDRIIVGHLLHLLYVRARWSDLFQVRNGIVDSQRMFFELETQIHKSAKRAETRSKLLPLVCPCVGVDGKDWVAIYLSLRERSGLAMPGVEDVCMMPAPSGSDDAMWSSRPLSSEEGACFLRKLLGAPKTQERRLSSHSMKSTAISWTSKFGLNFEARALLARHSSSVSNPTALHSRDLLSPVMRSFVHLISEIHGGQFVPDATRSGMLTPKPSSAAVPSTPVGQQVQLNVTEDHRDASRVLQVIHCKSSDEEETNVSGVQEAEGEGSALGSFEKVSTANPSSVEAISGDEFSSTSESNADDSSSGDEEHRIIDIYQHYGQADPLQFDFYINNTSCVLHCVGKEGRFKCGRLVTKTYSRVFELNGIRCSRCFDV